MANEILQLPAELSALWKEAVKGVPDSSLLNTKALFGGVNWEIDVWAALKAVYKTSIWVIKSAATIATNPTPCEMGEVFIDGWEVVHAILNALRKTMKPIEYCACVVLSDSPHGMEAAELGRQLGEHLDSLLAAKLPLPWIGLPRATLEAARRDLSDPSVVADLLTTLSDDGWITLTGTCAKFIPRHFSLGLTSA